jgi:copper(I)-binding protein
VDCEACREVLSAALDGEAARGERDEADAHLATCAACREHAEDLHALHRRLRLRPAEPVPDLAERIVAGLPPVPPPVPARRRPRGARRRSALVLAAAALAAASVVVVVTRPHGEVAGPAMVEVSDAYATPAAAGGLSSVYLTLRNRGSAEDALVEADCDDAGEVELHATVRSATGVPVMRTVDQFPLGPGATRSARAGSSHLMLVDVEHALRPGDELPLVLHFGHAPEVHLLAAVVDTATAAARSASATG